MFEWMDKTIQDANDTVWYPLILASLFHRVWVELFSGLSDAKPPHHHEILVFSGQLLFHVARRLSITVQGIMTPAQVISMLYDIDFVSLVGCVLVHSVITLDDQGRERKDVTEFTIALDSFISAFAKHTKLLKSIFEIRYPDWVNLSDHIRNLKAGLSTANHVNQRRLEECQTQWTEFGELFGYRENTRLSAVLNCCYARCAGVGAIVCKLARCAGCSKAVYCSLQCQQRDWLLESNPHREVCGKLHD
ncbi:hypothetical protein FRC12_019773 [Ceratobasidium sp. 428]|nr:hypothetical protein FRC12_019773 [Ceratobasidium sp. 428]